MSPARARPVVVAKVGGSLLDHPGLAVRLSEWLGRLGEDRQTVLVPGGGPFAESVRALDRIHALGDERAHALAIRSMSVSAYVLAALVPGLRVVDVSELGEAAPAGPASVLTLAGWLERDRSPLSELPAGWDVTSDSIAASMALHLGAADLYLVKRVDLPPGCTLERAARLGLVDPYFPTIAGPIPKVCWINLLSGNEARPLRP